MARPYSIDAAALGDKISGSKRLLLYRGISLESRRLLPDILSPSASINGCSVYRVRSLFPVNLPYGISMFLLVISVNHTNTIWKVSSWILLTGKSLLSVPLIQCLGIMLRGIDLRYDNCITNMIMKDNNSRTDKSQLSLLDL